MITHIVNRNEWYKAKECGDNYAPKSLDRDKFIHCSTVEKTIDVANYNFDCNDDLLVLLIDEAKVIAEVTFEDLYNLNYNYPHIYGYLNVNAVVGEFDFKCDDKCKFILPEELHKYL